MKPYYQDELVTIYHGDCREVLPYLPPVDLTISDLPYGVNKAGWDGNFPLFWTEDCARLTGHAMAIMPGIANVLAMPQRIDSFEYRWLMSMLTPTNPPPSPPQRWASRLPRCAVRGQRLSRQARWCRVHRDHDAARQRCPTTICADWRGWSCAALVRCDRSRSARVSRTRGCISMSRRWNDYLNPCLRSARTSHIVSIP